MTDEENQTLAQVIEGIAEGEAVLSAVIGSYTSWLYGNRDWPKENTVLLSWAEARPLLDHQWDQGYGEPGCPPFYAWTKSWLIAVHEYDGSTCVVRLPRDPVAIEPEYT